MREVHQDMYGHFNLKKKVAGLCITRTLMSPVNGNMMDTRIDMKDPDLKFRVGSRKKDEIQAMRIGLANMTQNM
jgi:hypothetical protein